MKSDNFLKFTFCMNPGKMEVAAKELTADLVRQVTGKKCLQDVTALR